MAMPTISRPERAYFRRVAIKSGTSSTQGAHQVAQKLHTSVLPAPFVEPAQLSAQIRKTCQVQRIARRVAAQSQQRGARKKAGRNGRDARSAEDQRLPPPGFHAPARPAATRFATSAMPARAATRPAGVVLSAARSSRGSNTDRRSGWPCQVSEITATARARSPV